MNELTIDSREVAEMTGKEHKNLMRDIRSYVKVLEDSSTLSSHNFFIESTYINSQNKEKPCYLLTRKGCDMIANKMAGEKGILFTATYVTKFEEMEQQMNKDIN
ncbi:Rha family transcriptional regulator [Clostridium saccharoperbutylacetonicum]|uniref:Rha family transcriptional regulator n=1 Tax=Clostridium saccharoperbutylacetonicum TaxID=36745 RepID=UPI0039EB06BD